METGLVDAVSERYMDLELGGSSGSVLNTGPSQDYLSVASLWISFPRTRRKSMRLRYQHMYGSQRYVYHHLNEKEESDSDYDIASANNEGASARGKVHGQMHNGQNSWRREKRPTRERIHPEKATRATTQSYPKSAYLISTCASSSSPISPSTAPPSMDTTHTEHKSPYRTNPVDNSKPSRPFISSTTCPRTDSAIELDTLTPTHSYRYPPGIVVIKTLDRHGIAVIEETDLTHGRTSFIDLKPAVPVRVEHTGAVQRRGKAGLMKRALEWIVDRLPKDDERVIDQR
jgi:hypothetical protein